MRCNFLLSLKSFLLLWLLVGISVSVRADDKVLAGSQKDLEAAAQKAKDSANKRMSERKKLIEEAELLQKEIEAEENKKSDLLKEEQKFAKITQDIAAGKNRLSAELEEFRQKFQLTKTEHNLNRPLSVLGSAGLIKEYNEASVVDFFKWMTEESLQASRCQKISGAYVDSNQQKIKGELVVIGNLQAYSLQPEAGLLYTSGTDFLQAKKEKISEAEIVELQRVQPFDVPLDVTGGAALQMPEIHSSVWFRLQDGGVVVYPILLVGAAALFIIIFKFFSLWTASGGTTLMEEQVCLAKVNDSWEELESRCRHKRQMVCQLVHDMASNKKKGSRITEEVLEEKIFDHIVKLEWLMPTLSVLGVISPLLGLLGTVTGMIATFDVMSVHGSSNPGLLSKGISEALITTELGLIVAIPIILFHSLLTSRIERQIQVLETVGDLLVERNEEHGACHDA